MTLRRLFCLSVVAGFATGIAWPQDQEALNVFAELKAAALSGPRAPTEVASVYDQIKALTDRLYERYLGRPANSGDLSPEYLRSLRDEMTALNEANTSEPEKRIEAARGVRDDLQVKVKFLSSGLGAGGAFPSVVQVTVETERQGKKADHLWVRCNPMRYGTTKTPMFPFNSETSPTSTKLPPGLFVIWVESTDGSKVLLSRPVTIGEGGADHEKIKLALP